jgi:hypothetical protein
MSTITLAEIIAAIPAVAAVLSSVQHVGDSECWGEYTRYKSLLKGLVGWDGPDYLDARLNSCQAFDAVVAALLDALDGKWVLPLPEEAGA